MSELTDVVEQNIRMVLLTNEGERIFNSEFGAGLQRYLFLSEVEVLRGVPGDDGYPPIKNHIMNNLQTYVPYITVENLEVTVADSLLKVSFKYFVNGSATASQFDLTVSDLT
jgi:phage baseplate assembly protein W